MTEPERRIARQLLDAARREAVAAEDTLAEARETAAHAKQQRREPSPTELLCQWCYRPFAPIVHNQRYCIPAHADLAWRRTAEGRNSMRDQKRRQRARQRATA